MTPFLKAYAGQAYHHTSPLLQCPSTSRTHGSLNYVTDLTIGTNYAHFLTSSREVVYTSLEDDDMVFAPRLQVYHGEEEEDAENFTWGNIGSQDCGHFVSIPTRPLPIADTKVDGSMAQDGLGPGTDARVCKIVEWDDAFLALRTNGDVWFFETVYRPGSPHWIYVSHCIHVTSSAEKDAVDRGVVSGSDDDCYGTNQECDSAKTHDAGDLRYIGFAKGSYPICSIRRDWRGGEH